MPIDRNKKAGLVAALAQRFSAARLAVVSDYRGLKVAELEELRRRLREVPAEFQVVKNTLAQRAARGTPLEVLVDYFDGPSSLTLASAKEIESAKILKEFARKFVQFEVRGGLLDGRLLSSAEVRELADTPSRDVLLGRAIGSLAAPLRGFLGVTAGLVRQFLYVLQAIHDQKAAA